MSFYKKAPLSVVNLVLEFNLNLAGIYETFEDALNNTFEKSEDEFGYKHCDLANVLADLQTETDTVQNTVIEHLAQLTEIQETTRDPRHKFEEFNYTIDCRVENNMLISNDGQKFTPGYFYNLHSQAG